MSDATGLYLLAAAIMVAAVFFYWIQPTRRAAVMAQSRNLIGLLILISAGISLVKQKGKQGKADDPQPA